MRREISARIQLRVTEPALLAFQIAAAATGQERFVATLDGVAVQMRQVAGPHGGRIHVLDAAPGHLAVEYVASVEGAVPVPTGGELDLLTYRRPSRYCPSDRFLAIADAEFGGLEPDELVRAVALWVRRRILYVGGSSRPTDDAVDTLLLGEGVCRDYAHLVLCLLRARDVPARLAAVYAPGLDPMDFHAVVEAWVDGSWRVADATGLAPRASMLRIATGRDAADTAWLSVHHGKADLLTIEVLATVDALPYEDATATLPLT